MTYAGLYEEEKKYLYKLKKQSTSKQIGACFIYRVLENLEILSQQTRLTRWELMHIALIKLLEENGLGIGLAKEIVAEHDDHI